MRRALREAMRLGHCSAGPAHIVLALLDEHRPSIAQEVLQASGIDRARIEAATHRQYRQGMDEHTPPRGATAEPLWHETAGRAQGFSATLGAGADDPEHVLLALLWQPHHRWFADLLSSAETSRDVIVAALAARGVPVPQSPPPELPPPKTQAAAFPKSRVNDVNWALRQSAPNLNWGIGSDPEEKELSVVLAAGNVDLATVLDDVVGEGAWTWRRRNDEVDAR
jgi:ATP-dependent Clp protease ATP-binding subunit ClpA